MAMLEGDATLQLMAGRAQMSVPEYFASLAPEAQAQHLERLTPTDVATDTAVNQSYGEQNREDTFRAGNSSEDARAAAIANAKAGPTANQNFPSSFGIEPVAPAQRPENPNMLTNWPHLDSQTESQAFPSSFGDQGPGFGERLRGYGSSALDAANRSAGVITAIGDYDRNRDFGESGGAPGDVGNLMQRGVSAISNAPGALARQTGELATNAASAVNRVVDPVLDYVAGVTANPNYGQTTAEDAETPPAEGDQSDEATNKLESAAAASEVPAVQADAEQGVAIARDVALSYGLRPGEDVTAAQTDRGSQAYVDRYYETVVPQAIEFYIGRGEMDKAQAYIELVESREGKAALRDIGRSTFSMMTGDVDAAAEHALSAFKQYGYVDPNMEVDLEATGLFNDADGNPGGARIVLLNKDTGERTEQTFATADEYLKYVHMMVSPATVAEMLFDNQPEQRGAITQQDVMKGASDIMSADLSGQTTMEQAIQQYMQGVQSLGTLSGGGGAQQEAPLFRLGNW
jgi:hypothetical protein